jgi:hypothetical protein
MDTLRPGLPDADERAASEPSPERRRVWLIARPACYRIITSDDDEVVCKIEAGSERVINRVVSFPRSQVQAALDQGDMRAVNRRPDWAADTLASKRASKLEQEAELNTQGPAEGKRKTTVKKGKVR